MRKILGVALFSFALAIPAGAQAQQAEANLANPISTWLRNAYMGVRNNIVRSAEKMPEENYGMRPGTQQEVRTFGQQVGHVADYNYLWCSEAKGEPNPKAGKNLEKLSTKAEFLKAVNDAFAYCDGVYSSLTDTSGAEVIDITQESGRHTRIPRMGLLIVNYLRMKDIVPSSSEPRPRQ